MDVVQQSRLKAGAMDVAMDQVRDVLRQEIPGILRTQFPSFAKLSNTQIYDSVLDNPDQLHASLRLLKTQPELFAKLLVDDKGQAMSSPDQPLSCQRTLSDVVTLVVRASARRYFRRKLGGSRRVLIAAKPRTVFQSFTDAIGLTEPPPRRTRREKGRGEGLYSAIREYLRFDWQAALIPAYAPLTEETIRQVGPKLLEIREPAELKTLAADEVVEGLRQGRQPLMLGPASALMRSSGDTIDGEIIYRVAQQMDLMRLFPDRDPARLRRAVAQIAGTSRGAIKQLLNVLGHDSRQFVGFLMIAYVTLGENSFRQVFGADGNSAWVVKRVMDRLGTLALPLPILEDMKQVYSELVHPPKDAPSGPMPRQPVDKPLIF